MKSLSAKQQEELSTWQTQLESAKQEIETAVTAANDKITAYNNLIGEVETWYGNITAAMDEYYEDRSEAWQQSEAGQEYDNWKENWQDASFDTVDTLEVGSIENPLDDLTSEPG